MRWWFGKRAAPSETPSPLGERLALVETDLRALRRDLDDLDDSFRSWRGRESKRQAREAAGNEGEAPTLVRDPTSTAPATPHQLRAAGKWPFGR